MCALKVIIGLPFANEFGYYGALYYKWDCDEVNFTKQLTCQVLTSHTPRAHKGSFDRNGGQVEFRRQSRFFFMTDNAPDTLYYEHSSS